MERLIRSSTLPSETLTRLPTTFSSHRLASSSARSRLSVGSFRPSPPRDLLPPLLLLHRDSSLSFKNSPRFAIKAAGSGPLPAELRPDVAARDERAPAEAAQRLSVDFLRKAFTVRTVTLLSALILLLLQPSFTPPAFATVRTATKAGTSAVGSIVRTELLSSAWTGFFAGCLHTLSGPDHLAALAPLSIGRTRIESAAVGALWGCGHDAGQMIFGLLFLLLKDRLHIEVIRTWGTRVVGMTLLVIGAMGIREATEVSTPCVALESGECIAEAIETTGEKKKIGLATFATGIVHGLQPDALMMVLPALALPSRLAGAAFLGMFLVGTVVAMGSYTVFIGSCSQALKDRVPRITEKLTWASSLVAIALGVAIIGSQLFGVSLY